MAKIISIGAKFNAPGKEEEGGGGGHDISFRGGGGGSQSLRGVVA